MNKLIPTQLSIVNDHIAPNKKLADIPNTFDKREIPIENLSQLERSYLKKEKETNANITPNKQLVDIPDTFDKREIPIENLSQLERSYLKKAEQQNKSLKKPNQTTINKQEYNIILNGNGQETISKEKDNNSTTIITLNVILSNAGQVVSDNEPKVQQYSSSEKNR